MSHLSQPQLLELRKAHSFLVSHISKKRKTQRAFDKYQPISYNEFLFHRMNRFFKKMLRGLSPSVWRLRRKLPFNWKEFGRKTDKAISYRSFFIGQKYARKEFKAFCLLLLLFSRTAVPNSLRRHGLQHTRPSCPSLSPRACTSSCPLNQ